MNSPEELKAQLLEWWPKRQTESDIRYFRADGIDEQIAAAGDYAMLFYVRPRNVPEGFQFSIERAFYRKSTGEFSLEKPEWWE